MKNEIKLTTAEGAPVDNDLATMPPGPREGYSMMQDVHLLEKLAHFNRERIPERVVHAKGGGAYGYFEITHDLSKYTCARFLSEVGKKTEVFVRFSTVGGERGSSDTARDPRGFAVKFYTEEGNYDLVGNNTPIFFIRDALKFPDFIHTQKRNPQTHLHDANAFWDFLSLTPESLHQVTILFSDRGTPANYRHMGGFGSHTFMWYNEKKEYVWVKYHFKPVGGWKTLSRQEAAEMDMKDPDSNIRDLFESIDRGEYPEWELFVQIMTPEQAKEYRFDPFDITKVWYHQDFPLIPVGRMVLNRNPDNYFADVEQAAFSPGNFVPGIFASPDKLLQGRLFAYHDAHRHRIGPNSTQVPVNMSKHAPAMTFQRDAAMAVDGNGGSGQNYYPNSYGTAVSPQVAPPPIELMPAMIGRHTRPVEAVDFEQPGVLFSRVMDDTQREHLIGNIAAHLGNACEALQYRQCALFYKAHPDYGLRVAAALNLVLSRVEELGKLQQEELVAATPIA